MKIIALVAAMMMMGVVSPAQVMKSRSTCPCDRDGFKPITPKARAVAEYWRARRKYRTTSTVAGSLAIFGVLAHDQSALREAENAQLEAERELEAARTKATELDGIKVLDPKDKDVEIKLQPGVDYTLKS